LLNESPMAEDFNPRIFLMDTGPLITLAAAESLDYLLILDLPVIIPDAVFYEATSNSTAIGAADIAEWTQAHADQINIVPSQVFASHFWALTHSQVKVPNLGESAALEVARYSPFLNGEEQALLLTEDDKVLNGLFIPEKDRERIIVLSTHDYLDGLEKAQKINSTAAVYARANDGGRFASEKKAQKENHDRAMAALDAALRNQEARKFI
jgi:hypothetical protein